MSGRAIHRVLWVLAAVLAVSLALAAAPALADTSNIGRNLGNEVRSWATALLFGVAALVGLPILFRRDVNAGLVLVLLVIVVGGFVFAPTAVREVIRGLWQAIGG
jgi:FtsH-binding integral membrane protein